MSKFLALGMPLEDVVAKATGPVEFVGTRNNKRPGKTKLVPVLTIRAGRPFGHPPLPTPFVF